MAPEHESIRQFTEPPLPPPSSLRAALARLGPWLERRPRWTLAVVVVACVAAYGAAVALGASVPEVYWVTAIAVLAAALALVLSGAGRSETPPMDEARLMALTARIRPHFLYNSLNAILGTMRSDPRTAETALEEMAELFRSLMHDPRQLTPLSDELALCRKYLSLERLRLGDRVQVLWDIEQCPPDALVPPLMLQPLLENAIYHGVEPLEKPGPIAFRLLSAGRMLVIELSNPQATRAPQAQGNRMALANIRERLEIYYGLAAYLNAEVQDGRHTVRIVVPYQKATQ